MLRTILIILSTVLVTLILTISGLTLYIVQSNPFNIQACMISSFLSPTSQTSSGGETNEVGSSNANIPQAQEYDHPLLNEEQETILEDIGVDISTLPQEISPEMERCFTEALDEERVKEIMGGDTPGPIDLLKAKSCLQFANSR